MSMPTDAERRSEAVAALRAMADQLESCPWLPVPFYGSVQASAHDRRGSTEAQRFAALRALAERIGVAVVEHHTRSRSATLRFGPFTYVAHENPDETSPSGSDRIVPAEEDAALIAA